MNLLSLYYKLRMWGVRGVVNHFLNLLRRRKFHRFFSDNARRFPCPKPQRGLTLIAEFSSQGSLHKAMRDFAFSLKDAGIPFQTYDLGRKEIPEEDLLPILTPLGEFRIRRYSDVVEMISSPLQDGIADRLSRVFFWEYQEGLVEAFPTLVERRGDVIAMSDFNYECFLKTLANRMSVFKILYPFRFEEDAVFTREEARRHFGLSENDYVVFYNFSYGSGWGRKNPLGALRAFAAAFSDAKDAKMVFKTFSRSGFEFRERQLLETAKACGVEDRLVFVDDYLTQKELYGLTNACDVYLSLHRAEGFGLGIAEAMSLGKPVVVTDYSATTEFCNGENSLPVKYSLAKIRAEDRDLQYLVAAKLWAEPDIQDAAMKLRKLYEDRKFSDDLGRKAKESIRTQFSVDKFKESVDRFLDR